MSKISSSLTIETPEQSQWRHSSVLIFKLELISNIALFTLLTF